MSSPTRASPAETNSILATTTVISELTDPQTLSSSPLSSGSPNSIFTSTTAIPVMARPRRRNKEKLEPVDIPEAPRDSPFILGFHEDKNAPRRRKMEDAHAFFYDFNNVKGQGFFAVFDGHGGRAAAAWCGDNFHDLLRKNLPSLNSTNSSYNDIFVQVSVPEIFDQTFVEADSFLNAAHGIYSGCTAIVALFRFEKRLESGLDREEKDFIEDEDEHGASIYGQEEKLTDKSCNCVDSGSLPPPLTLSSSSSSSSESLKRYIPVLYTANVGDSRAVLCRNGQAIRLSYDHKGSDLSEQQRVKDAGGFIMNERVNGMLAITRALGDAELKEYISGRPYTAETIIGPDDEFLILACDGLWDVCGDQQACELVRSCNDPQRAATRLVEYGLENGSFDNMSVLVVRFRHDRFPIYCPSHVVTNSNVESSNSPLDHKEL